MRLSAYLATIAALAVPSLQAPQAAPEADLVERVFERLQSQYSASYDGVLSNVGGSGKSDANAPGASPGLVVASPTKENPNYFYTWTRDSSLAFKAIIDASTHKIPVEKLIQNYITAQAKLQNTTNPSGSLCTGGLGETRFYINGTVVYDDWPRPQSDGPALRVQALVSYANYLLANGHKDTVESIIWPVVQNDLTYVSEHWNETTYDLWESIKSSSMFATAMQYRALVEGNDLAKKLGKQCPNCESEAPQILCFLQSYWTGSYMSANTGGGRSGVDVQTVLASIHIYDPEASCESTYFQPCSDRALANHKVVLDSFRSNGRSPYKVNGNKTTGGIAVGRYPEDQYFNGNPWYLSNFGAAEQLYYAVAQWKRQGHIEITPISQPFFKDLKLPPAAFLGIHSPSSSHFSDIIKAVKKYADELMMFPPNVCVDCGMPFQQAGSMHEQFSRDDGRPLSAAALTWSNAAFLTAMTARTNADTGRSSTLTARDVPLPVSWGASTVRFPRKCKKSSATGACSPPTNTDWPQ